jgi:hypothetical protein
MKKYAIKFSWPISRVNIELVSGVTQISFASLSSRVDMVSFGFRFQVNCCWPSPGQPLLVSNRGETHDSIFSVSR